MPDSLSLIGQIISHYRIVERIGAGHGGSPTRLQGTEVTRFAHTLEVIVEQARALDEIRKTDLRCGDRVLVSTRNSLYTLWALGDGHYWVWGGWFDRRAYRLRKWLLTVAPGAVVQSSWTSSLLQGFAWSSGTLSSPLGFERFA